MLFIQENATYAGFINAYNLFSPRIDFTFSFILHNNQALIRLRYRPSTLNATATNRSRSIKWSCLIQRCLDEPNTYSTLSNICGSVLPLTLLDFAGQL
jgi:hypothetical protein